MTNLMIPIDEGLFARLQKLAQYHGRDVTTEAQVLLAQSLESATQPLTGDFLHSFFKDIPAPQCAAEELVIEPRNRHKDRLVDMK